MSRGRCRRVALVPNAEHCYPKTRDDFRAFTHCQRLMDTSLKFRILGQILIHSIIASPSTEPQWIQ